MMRILIATLLFCPILLLAQKPFINSISPTHVEVGETVTISGSNLGTPRVFFGGVEATVLPGSTANLILAEVPAGATHGPISVLNNGDMVQSAQQFFISFSGSDIDNYDAEQLISSTEDNAYDICMCDLDGDLKNDIVMAHNSPDNTGSEITIYENTTVGTGAFTNDPIIKIDDPINDQGAIAVTCGDLNNDGKPEIIFSANSGSFSKEVFVYENQSTPGNVNMVYSASASLAIPQAPGSVNRVPRKARVADLDGDGNPDIVVGNEVDATIHVFRGNGDLTFETPDEIPVSNALRTSTIEVADFNNDSNIDIVVIPFRISNERVYILKNKSLPGNISFELEAGITASAQRLNVATADFDEDGKIDLVVTNLQLQRVSFHRNISTGTDILFDNALNVAMTGVNPWGVDIGDMNGDGKPDAIIGSTAGTNELFVIENSSTTGSLSFLTPTSLSTTNTNQNLCVGDLNNDARPDIAYTHNIQTGNPGNLGIFINRNCVEPVINPSSFSFCSGEDFTLTTTNTINATYTWTILPGTTTITASNSETFNIVSTSDQTIEVQIDQGGCSTTQQIVVQYEPGSVSGPPVIIVNDSDAGDICAGDQVTLSTTVGFDEYLWTHPDNSTSTSPTINFSSISSTDAGEYMLTVRSGTDCSSATVTQNVEVKQLPIFTIVNSNLDDFCAGTSVTLGVPDFTSDFNYQWQRNGVDLGTVDENNAEVTVNQTGNYSVEVTNATTCLSETSNYTINSIPLPTSVANGPSETCVAFETSFTSASTGQSGFTLQYEWVVEDASDVVIHTATTQDLDFTFPNTGDFEVILNTNYDPTEVYAGPNPGDICVTSDPIAVTVSPEPTITFNVADGVEKCQAETINIQLDSPPSATISSYSWSTRNAVSSPNDTIIASNVSTGPTIDLSTPIGIDSVYAIVSITTTIGCEVKDSVKVRNFPSDVDISSPDQDASSDEITLDEANFIRLSAEDVTAVSWSSDAPDPIAIFDNPNSIDVTVFPNQPRTIVTVTGTDDNGCTVASQVVIILDNLRPKKTFSPNGDAINDCWEIINSSQPNTQGCKVYIFDSRGRNIKVADAPFANNCVWDGNSNGSPVPEGVYYFVLKCSDDQMSKSGSILLAR